MTGAENISYINGICTAVMRTVIGSICAWKGMFLGFYSTDPDVLYYAEQRLIIATTLELLTAVYEISAGAMRGLGHSLLPAIITVVGSCVLRLIWISTVCKVFHEFWVLIIIYPISWIVTGIIMVIAYNIIKRKVVREAR